MPTRIVTAAEMQELDRRASAELGIPSIVLMENAARSCLEVIEEYFRDDEGECAGLAGLRALVVCGKGNNGGDGLALARLLANRDAIVRVILLGKGAELRNDPKVNYDILKHCPVEVTEAETPREFDRALQAAAEPEIIVDAIFGTGFRGRAEGIAAQAIRRINKSDAFVLAVDIASGLPADDGRPEGEAVLADATVTMALLKRGLVLPPGREHCGDVWVGDIGMPNAVLNSGGDTFSLEREEVLHRLPPRLPSGHKGTFGSVLTVAGSPGFSGAACLASTAALRIGCGLSRLAVPEALLGVVEARLTEVVKAGLAQTADGGFSTDALFAARRLLESADVLALGPGIGTRPETREFELALLRAARVPLVIDADGINNLAGQTDSLKTLRVPVVLTPHPGELARLIDKPVADINAGRIDIARACAREWGVVLVLKGAPTVTAGPDGMVCVNPTGNCGLGSGGTGDVLTGMIAGLIAQGAAPLAAAQVGVYLHGMAADLAAEEKTEYGLVAGDLLDFLPAAIKALEGGHEPAD